MVDRGGGVLVLSRLRTVASTGSTNADMLAAAAVQSEGDWLRAERQTAGRGRLGRTWESPAGNFYGSTLVRLRRSDPPAETLALVAGVALAQVVTAFVEPSVGSAGIDVLQRRMPAEPGSRVTLKWPNDLLLDGAKLAGILLERAGDAVVVGLGVNLAHHPEDLDRLVTDLAAQGHAVDPVVFAEALAESFARWLTRWRCEGLAVVRTAWLAGAHSTGTALTVRLPDGEVIEGLFDGLDASGALLLRLAGGERRAVHAGDVFLL